MLHARLSAAHFSTFSLFTCYPLARLVSSSFGLLASRLSSLKLFHLRTFNFRTFYLSLATRYPPPRLLVFLPLADCCLLTSANWLLLVSWSVGRRVDPSRSARLSFGLLASRLSSLKLFHLRTFNFRTFYLSLATRYPPPRLLVFLPLADC
jgi:hypothetical protein